MKKNILIFLFSLLSLSSALMANDTPTADGVEGYWVVMEGKKPASIMGVYVHNGTLYGKVLVSFDPKDVTKYATMDKPTIAEKLEAKPPMQGLDIIWGGKKEINEKKGESRWTGARILDPRGPKLYGAELWREGDTLKMRGSLLSASWLGSTMAWYPLKDEFMPKDYTLPRLDSLKPTVHDEFKGR